METYTPVLPFGQMDRIGGEYEKLVAGGCGSTRVTMKIGERAKCPQDDRPHHCVGVHSIAIAIRVRWMGSDTVERSLAGEVHMVSECYGNVVFQQGDLRATHAEDDGGGDGDGCDADNIGSVGGADGADGGPRESGTTTPLIRSAKLIFMGVPTRSALEAGDEEWAGMSGLWNRLADVLMVFPTNAEGLGNTVDFERANELVHLHMKQPPCCLAAAAHLAGGQMGCGDTEPLYEITFHFDSPLAVSNRVQSELIPLLAKGADLPAEVEHEDFTAATSALDLFSGDLLDANLRAYATFTCSPAEQLRSFDVASFRALAGDEMICAKMRVGDAWLLAATSMTRTALPAGLPASRVTWHETQIGTVWVSRRPAERGRIIVTLC